MNQATHCVSCSFRMASAFPTPAHDAQVVVFDFDHTLFDGDSFTHALRWMLKRHAWRRIAAVLATPILGPMVAYLPLRRRGIGGYVWIATVGLHRRRSLDELLDRYVTGHTAELKERLLPIGLEVLHRHRMAGDRVVVATGAPPELARAILKFVAHEDVPVIGTATGPRFGAVVATRHCHHQEKVRMLRERGYTDIAVAYTDSSADLPLLLAARMPVVVNPKAEKIEMFRRVLPPGTRIVHWGSTDRSGDVFDRAEP